MKIYLSQNLKKLREKKGNTQEELARHIGITVQSVSKWERGEAYPDVETLPVIAEFYSVTVDDLLGVGEIEKRARVKKFLEEYRVIDKNHEYDKALLAANDMYRDYPNDISVLKCRMDALRNLGCFEESLETSKEILNHQNSGDVRYEAIRNAIACNLLSAEGDYDEAKRLADELPDYFATKNQQRINIGSSGAELFKTQVQENIEMLMLCLCTNIRALQYGMSKAEKIDLWKKAVKILDTVFENGDYGMLTEQVLRFYLFTAHDYAMLNEDDKALEYLEISANLAEKSDKETEGKYSSMLFKGRSYQRGTDASAALSRQMQYWAGFYHLKGNERFIKILERMKKHADFSNEHLVAGDAMLYNINGIATFVCDKLSKDYDFSDIRAFEKCDVEKLCERYTKFIPNCHYSDENFLREINTENNDVFVLCKDNAVFGVGVVAKNDGDVWEITSLSVTDENDRERLLAYCTKHTTDSGKKAQIRVSVVSYGVILPAKEMGYERI